MKNPIQNDGFPFHFHFRSGFAPGPGTALGLRPYRPHRHLGGRPFTVLDHRFKAVDMAMVNVVDFTRISWIFMNHREFLDIIKIYIYIYQNGAASRDFTRIPGTMVINHQELEYVFLRKTLCRAGDWQMFYYNISNWWYTYPLKIWKSDWLIIPTIGENKGHIPNHQPDITIYLLVVEWGPCQTNRSTNGPQPDIERDQISTVIAIKGRFFNLYQLASNGILMWSNDIIQDILWR